MSKQGFVFTIEEILLNTHERDNILKEMKIFIFSGN